MKESECSRVLFRDTCDTCDARMSARQSKRWSESHLILAAAVERVRGDLRRMAGRIAGEDGAHLGRLAAMLTAGLKARGAEMLPMLREEARERMLSGKHHEDPRAILPEGEDETGKAVEIAARILNTGAEVSHG